MARRPTVRLLFDEDVSPKVARALRELDFNVEHVGGTGQPSKSSSDEEVLAFAQQSHQVIVTRNHDMIMLCAERGVSVVWLDPHRQHLRLDEQAAMAFGGIAEWCARLAEASEPVCLRVLRTRLHVLPVVEGAEAAAKRYHAIRKRAARGARRKAKASPADQLSTDDV